MKPRTPDLTITQNPRFLDTYRLVVGVEINEGVVVDLARSHGFRVLTLDIKKENYGVPENLEYDFLASCGWGYKIPLSLIDKAKIAAINCHSSFLPDYKGASVYLAQWANCESFGGATIHFLDSGFDSGRIITQGQISIKNFDSPSDILEKASFLTAALIREALLLIEKGFEGSENIGGRYFKSCSRIRLLLHRITNITLKLFGSGKRWLTPHKYISTKP